jgi:hypothetical protein
MRQIPSATVVQAPRWLPLTPRFTARCPDFCIPVTRLSPQSDGLHMVGASKSCLPELGACVTDAGPRFKFFSDNSNHCHCSRPHHVPTLVSVVALFGTAH